MKERIIDFIESIFRFGYGWISPTEEALGKIIHVIHMFGAMTLFLLVIFSHTIYPVFWFQFVMFVVCLAIWLQHIFLQNCVVTMIENKLLKTTDEGIDRILDLFGIPLMKETRMGFTLITGTVIVGLLGLELISRSVMFFRSSIGASTWI
jgi:hypothetical protein